MLSQKVMEELIGQNVRITKSARKELIGIEGKITDETLNTLTIEVAGTEKKVPKVQCIFEIGGECIDGKDLAFRPEDRIKKHWLKFKRR